MGDVEDCANPTRILIFEQGMNIPDRRTNVMNSRMVVNQAGDPEFGVQSGQVGNDRKECRELRGDWFI